MGESADKDEAEEVRAEAPPPAAGGWRRWPIAIAAAVFALPVLIDLAISDRQRVFDYLATDAFYYLTVARNFADHGQLTFDQIHGTNGYHPVWQFLLAAVAVVTGSGGAASSHLMLISLLVGVALIAAAIGLLGACAKRPDGTVWPLFALLPAGLFGALCAPWWWPRFDFPGAIRPLIGTLWSYVNGMESAAVLVCYGAVAYLYCYRDPLASTRRAVAFGLTLALLTLSRLDHGVFAAAFAGALGWRAWALGDRWQRRRAATVVATFVGLLAVYVGANQLVYGAPIPVSGALKSSFPAIRTNNFGALGRLFGGDPPRAWLPMASRQVQIVIPLLFALATLPFFVTRRPGTGWRRVALRLRPGRGRFEEFLLATAVGVIGLGSYNLLYVHPTHQGHWYFPISTTFVSLVMCAILDRTRPVRWLTSTTRRTLAWQVAAGALVLAFFAAFLYRPGGGRRLAWFYFDGAPRMLEHFRAQAELPDEPRMVSFDDGIVAFATGLPTMSGYGFNLDAEAARYKEKGRLLEVAAKRGFARVTGLQFMRCRGLLLDPSQQAFQRVLRRKVSRHEVKKYVYQVDYFSTDGRYCVIRVEPKPSHLRRMHDAPPP